MPRCFAPSPFLPLTLHTCHKHVRTHTHTHTHTRVTDIHHELASPTQTEAIRKREKTWTVLQHLVTPSYIGYSSCPLQSDRWYTFFVSLVSTYIFVCVHLHFCLVLVLTVAKSGEHANGNLQTEAPSAVLKPEEFRASHHAILCLCQRKRVVCW